MAKEFSTSVLGLKMGMELVVVVYGEKNIRQVFTEKEFEGRPDNFFIRLRCLGKRLGNNFSKYKSQITKASTISDNHYNKLTNYFY